MTEYDSYRQWLESLTEEELEDAYKEGGSRDDFGLVQAFLRYMRDKEDD